MSDISRQIVTTRWGEVHLRSVRGHGTPLLLLHMSPLSGGMYTALLEHMAGRRTAIAPDRYGCGGSDRAPRALSMTEYADGVVDVLDALGLDEIQVLGKGMRREGWNIRLRNEGPINLHAGQMALFDFLPHLKPRQAMF